jgi:hypothetical protein
LSKVLTRSSSRAFTNGIHKQQRLIPFLFNYFTLNGFNISSKMHLAKTLFGFFILPFTTLASQPSLPSPNPTRTVKPARFPSSAPSSGQRVSQINNHLSPRVLLQTNSPPPGFISTVGNVIKVIKSVTGGDDAEKEIEFIADILTYLHNHKPTSKYNILVYHDEKGRTPSVRPSGEWGCMHVELEFDDLLSDIIRRSKGYEVCLVERRRYVRGKNQEGERGIGVGMGVWIGVKRCWFFMRGRVVIKFAGGWRAG